MPPLSHLVLHHVSCLASNVSCFMSHVSCLMCPMPHVSCLMSHVPCLMSHASYLMSHPSPISPHLVWEGPGLLRRPHGEARARTAGLHFYTIPNHLMSSQCLHYVYPMSRVGIRAPCPAVVNTAHPRRTLQWGGLSSPSVGLHACSPARAHAALREDAQSRRVNTAPTYSVLCVPQGGITRAGALAALALSAL